MKNKCNKENRLWLRPYKACDAATIISWCKDEEAFRKWSSDRWESYPITEEDMNKKYLNNNGDCPDSDNFYPMTLLDGNEIVGHLILRFVDEERTNLRLGFVIVDDSKRGMGYGKEMLLLTIKYAFEIMKVDKVNLGVFDNNMPAYHCYKAVGFKEIELEKPIICNICGEAWNVIELELEKADYQA